MNNDGWRDRVRGEEKFLINTFLCQQRRTMIEGVLNGRSNPTPSCCIANTQVHEEIQRDHLFVQKNGGKVDSRQSNVPTRDQASVAPSSSLRSNRSTQLSHHAASSVNQHPSVTTNATRFTARLEDLEKKLVLERTERRRVQTELLEIKELLLKQNIGRR